MKTIELTDEQFELYKKLDGDKKSGAPEVLIVILLSLIYGISPEGFEQGWDDLKRVLPNLPLMEEWRAITENLVSPVRMADSVMGGAPCIRNSRIPVWALVSLKKQGMTDGELLRAYPSLEASDVEAAWSYYHRPQRRNQRGNQGTKRRGYVPRNPGGQNRRRPGPANRHGHFQTRRSRLVRDRRSVPVRISLIDIERRSGRLN